MCHFVGNITHPFDLEMNKMLVRDLYGNEDSTVDSGL